MQGKLKNVLRKKTSIMANEEDCKLEETLNDDTSSIALLDTGSTFNSTNNENALAQTVRTHHLQCQRQMSERDRWTNMEQCQG